MRRRSLIVSSLAAAAATPLLAPLSAWAQDDRPADRHDDDHRDDDRHEHRSPGSYTGDEVIHEGSRFLGVTAEALGGAVEHIFKDYGDRPTGYIAGTETSGAWAVGLRYGKGSLYMKGGEPRSCFWQGPSIGFDAGGNAGRVFTLCYGLDDPDQLFQRFPGVEGSAYFVGGLGVTYQRADDITLAPIRAGVGLRLGANVGYIAYSRKRHWVPF
ncbi:MAG TPA: DUF1134 domain-containing protein [Caulobacteraceae bacterium]|jgi:hypothetical protein|nr:DUF1134 domain-containing protein [Caulobacteraceae bacterium]